MLTEQEIDKIAYETLGIFRDSRENLFRFARAVLAAAQANTAEPFDGYHHDIATAIGELSAAMGCPAVMSRRPQSVLSQTVRAAIPIVAAAQAQVNEAIQKLRNDVFYLQGVVNDITSENKRLQAQAKPGTTCQTYGHWVDAPCAECNTVDPQAKPEGAKSVQAADFRAHDFAATVQIPTTQDQAAGMVLVGTAWLRDNAPHRLTDQAKSGPATN